MRNENYKDKDLFINSSSEMPMFFERVKCKTLCHKYNQLSPDMLAARQQLIKKIIGKTGGLFLIEQPFMCDYGCNIKIGANFYSNHNLLILDAGEVVFGDNVLIGPNCSFYTPKHPLDAKTRNKGLDCSMPIKVGNNVWICGNVTVLAGVSIGDNSVIGAGSLVNKDIPPNVLAAGNPCKIVKKIS